MSYYYICSACGYEEHRDLREEEGRTCPQCKKYRLKRFTVEQREQDLKKLESWLSDDDEKRRRIHQRYTSGDK